MLISPKFKKRERACPGRGVPSTMEAGGSDPAVVSPITVGWDKASTLTAERGQGEMVARARRASRVPFSTSRPHTRAAAEKFLFDCLGRRSQKRESGCRRTFFLPFPLPFPLFLHSLSSPITFLSQPRAMANTSQAPSPQSSSMDPPRSPGSLIQKLDSAGGKLRPR